LHQFSPSEFEATKPDWSNPLKVRNCFVFFPGTPSFGATCAFANQHFDKLSLLGAAGSLHEAIKTSLNPLNKNTGLPL